MPSSLVFVICTLFGRVKQARLEHGFGEIPTCTARGRWVLVSVRCVNRFHGQNTTWKMCKGNFTNTMFYAEANFFTDLSNLTLP